MKFFLIVAATAVMATASMASARVVPKFSNRPTPPIVTPTAAPAPALVVKPGVFICYVASIVGVPNDCGPMLVLE